MLVVSGVMDTVKGGIVGVQGTVVSPWEEEYDVVAAVSRGSRELAAVDASSSFTITATWAGQC